MPRVTVSVRCGNNRRQFFFRASMVDADRSFRGRPRGRGVMVMPNRAAIPSTQAGEPIGRPVRSEPRTALSSSGFWQEVHPAHRSVQGMVHLPILCVRRVHRYRKWLIAACRLQVLIDGECNLWARIISEILLPGERTAIQYDDFRHGRHPSSKEKMPGLEFDARVKLRAGSIRASHTPLDPVCLQIYISRKEARRRAVHNDREVFVSRYSLLGFFCRLVTALVCSLSHGDRKAGRLSGISRRTGPMAESDFNPHHHDQPQRGRLSELLSVTASRSERF